MKIQCQFAWSLFVATCNSAVIAGQLEEATHRLKPDERPNIVFISAEDVSPDFGCYGNPVARTPNLDRLAADGVRFDRMFTHCPVCAPSRSGMITGRYPISIGTHHMRSRLQNPPPMFTERLIQSGYHVCWPGKTDFNFDPPPESFSSTEKWNTVDKIKSLPRPFFAYINLNATHESRLKGQDFEKVISEIKVRTNPAVVRVPAYLPDVPEVRQSIADYFDTVAALDKDVGKVLSIIEDAGIKESTVIVFWGDHGWGMPRSKRWCYDSGIRCPLIIRWPGKIPPGSVRDDLVSVVDLAPTFLKITKSQMDPGHQGQWMIDEQGNPNPKVVQYVFSARDRMDEATDRVRSARNDRFHYIRNYSPEKPYDQPIEYLEAHPVMKVMRKMHREGSLSGPPEGFFAPKKPSEELYDTLTDPDEVNNLIDSKDPLHQQNLESLRMALDEWLSRIGDMGNIDEDELIRRGILIGMKLPGYQKAEP